MLPQAREKALLDDVIGGTRWQRTAAVVTAPNSVIFLPLTHVLRVRPRPGDAFARLLQPEAAVACVQRADALARGARRPSAGAGAGSGAATKTNRFYEDDAGVVDGDRRRSGAGTRIRGNRARHRPPNGCHRAGGPAITKLAGGIGQFPVTTPGSQPRAAAGAEPES
jgi:hypothetical protein